MAKRPAEVDRLDFLIGQVLALKSFALAATATHAEHALLKKHFEMASQVALAKIEATLTSDKTIRGFQSVVDEIFAVLSNFEVQPERR